MFATSLPTAKAHDAMSPPAHEARDASWLLGLPLVIALLLAVAFSAMSLEAKRTSGLATGTCSKPSRAAMIHQMLTLH